MPYVASLPKTLILSLGVAAKTALGLLYGKNV